MTVITAPLAGALLSGTVSAAEAGDKALSIRYERGFIDYRITDVPLKEALDDLAGKTGTLVILTDPDIGVRPVSASAQAVPLEAGIKRLLEGFSYAFYRVGLSHAVIVLSTPPRPRRVGRSTASPSLPSSDPSRVSADGSPMAEQGDVHPTPPATGVPQSLDAFRAVIAEGDPGAYEEQPAESTDPSAESARDLELREALLERALDALGSEHRHLHAQAIDELGSLQDFRATEALIKATQSGALRLQALEALGRHAVYPGFAEGTAVQALQRLANDSDRDISQLAQQLLESMQHMEAASAMGEVGRVP